MLFGQQSAFAIEAMSEPTLQRPSAVWGRMQVWCCGISIGDYSEPHCSLYGSYLGFKDLAQCLASLWRPEFDGLQDLELWNLLDGLLYGFHGEIELDDHRSVDESIEDSKNYGMHNFLTNWGEQFDHGGKSFIFCRPAGQVMILNRHLADGVGISLEVPLADVLAAIHAFLVWFEDEAERLGFPVH